MTTPIPSPPGLPLVGNVFELDPQNQKESLQRLANIYGMFYPLLNRSQAWPNVPRPHL